MSDDLMPFDLPEEEQSSIIKVLGVGGGGGNAVNHMFKQGIKDVNFVICNTDAQALTNSPVPIKIQLGASLTQGLGAGNKPGHGREAAIESLDTVSEALSENTKMIFITAGMGGGTGTGAAPVIAKAAKEKGILTVAIVTIPFRFEGKRRINQAIEGIDELSKNVDSLLVINNEKLREIYGNLNVSDAFAQADNVLTVAAKGIAEIITVPGYVNVDFADVRTVMQDSGVAVMGSASAEGEGRALEAVKNALNSPLLNNNDITGAKNILLNIISGSEEVTMDEVTDINDYVQEASGYTADLIWGNTTDESLGEKITVTVIATGFESDAIPELYARKGQKKTVMHLDDNKVAEDDIPFEIKRSDDNTSYQEHEDEDMIAIDEELNNDEDSQEDVFELMDNDDMDSDEEIENDEEIDENAKIAVERMNELKKKLETSSENRLNFSNLKDIDTLENVPAYIRKNIKIDLSSKSKKSNISRYSLSDDDENDGIQLNSKNSYLHDNVD